MNFTQQETNYIKDALTCLIQRNTSDILERYVDDMEINKKDPINQELNRRNVEMAKILLRLGHKVEEEIEMDDDSFEEEKQFIEWDERTTHELD